MFLSNLNGFNSPLSPSIQGLLKGKVLPRHGRKRDPSDFITFLFLSSCFCVWITCVFCFQVLSQSSFMLFVCFQFCLFCFSNKKNWKIRKIQKQCVFVYIGTCVPWMAIITEFSKFCISCSLDEHFYAQLSKWVLWLVFMMSKIK